MGSSLYLSMITCLLFSLSFFHLVKTASSSSKHPLCHTDEKSALLQFKESFLIDNRDASTGYPKTESWKIEESSDCCSWDGVVCDNNTGHVVGLDLNSSLLYGSINSSSSLFRLVHLQMLSLADNDFNHSQIPSRFGDLSSLKVLNLSECSFSGSIPSSLGNLTQLTALDLSSNHFEASSGKTLAWLGKQTKLTYLGITQINLTGEIPSFLGNLTQLTALVLHNNQLSGQIPSWLANLTQLTVLELSINELNGPIPQSLYGLVNLEYLNLYGNNLSGTVEFNMFSNLKNLVELQLSLNKLSLLTHTNITATLPKFKILGLAACNLRVFPNFLRHQDEMEFLELAGNNMEGQIPKWIGNIGKDTLQYLSVSQNNLTGFEQRPPVVLPWTSLRILMLHRNMLQGSLPIPPASIVVYAVASNSLTGEISPWICNLTSLQALFLSSNNLSGILPQCLGNFSDSLILLDLRNNNFYGTIPQTYTKGCSLWLIDLSQNRLQGSLPRSLTNCKMLEILDFGNNGINDTFPSWLGTLRNLSVLMLPSNEFHGTIKNPKTKSEFPKLHIIDLSWNSFTGKLPFEYFENWNAMKIVGVNHLTYLDTILSVDVIGSLLHLSYRHPMTLACKGTKIMYMGIPDTFTSIDFSGNRFEGDIPKSIGNLKALQLLNLSNNILTGGIPSCLGNLTNLEALDLSQNMLSGEIPQHLVGLTFLAILNVSHNHLTGSIPQGNQFGTFDNSSFEGNLGLCGDPLPKKCGNSKVSPPPPLTLEQSKGSKFPSGYDWLFIGSGYGSGLVVGLVVGQILTTKKHEWFVETFGRRSAKSRRGKKRGRRNFT